MNVADLDLNTLRTMLLQASDTFDALGVEAGDWSARLAFLRGAVGGLKPLQPAKARRKLEGTERKAKHHPSWELEQPRFFATLAELGIRDPYRVIAAFCESRNLPRPSAMTSAQRTQFVTAFSNPDKRVVYDEWVGAHALDLPGSAEEAA